MWEDVKKCDGIEEGVKELEKEDNVKMKVVEKGYGDEIEGVGVDGGGGRGGEVMRMREDEIG